MVYRTAHTQEGEQFQACTRDYFSILSFRIQIQQISDRLDY